MSAETVIHDIAPVRGIGDNNPPADTPFDKAQKEIDDLYGEATLWLDGAAVDSQELADGIANLLNLLRAAEKVADKARATEKKPHDDAGKAVQAKYKPILDKAQLATEACKRALAPWLAKLEEEKRAAAERARLEAEAKARAAQEALRAADAANLEERARAEDLAKEAKAAGKAASRAERSTAQAGSVGRAVSLRTVYRAEITDEREFARYVWANHRPQLVEFLQGIANNLTGPSGENIPGLTIHQEKRAV